MPIALCTVVSAGTHCPIVPSRDDCCLPLPHGTITCLVLVGSWYSSQCLLSSAACWQQCLLPSSAYQCPLVLSHAQRHQYATNMTSKTYNNKIFI